MPVKVLVGCARPKAAHADEGGIGADDLVPALPDPGFHGDLHLCRTDDGASLRQRQRPEKLKSGHRDYPRMNAALAQKFARLHGERHLRAAGEERNLRIASLRRDNLVGAHGAAVGLFATEA